MVVVRQVLDGALLIAMTVAIHALGTIIYLRILSRYRHYWKRHLGLITALLSLSGIVGFLVVLHLLEITVWASYYHLQGLLPDFESAAYYSIATYTTVGYGDVVLPREWRLEGTAEALVGILMTAWSTALLYKVINKFHERVADHWDPAHAEASQRDRPRGSLGDES